MWLATPPSRPPARRSLPSRRSRAGEVEAARVGEHGLVVVGRDERHAHDLPGLQVHAVELDAGDELAVLVDDHAVAPHELGEGRLEQGWVVAHGRELLGVAVQDVEEVRERAVGRLAAGHQHERDERRDLGVRQRLPSAVRPRAMPEMRSRPGSRCARRRGRRCGRRSGRRRRCPRCGRVRRRPARRSRRWWSRAGSGRRRWAGPGSRRRRAAAAGPRGAARRRTAPRPGPRRAAPPRPRRPAARSRAGGARRRAPAPRSRAARRARGRPSRPSSGR